MLSPERLGCTTKPNSHKLFNEPNLLEFLWFRMLYSSALIEICPWEVLWFKVFALQRNNFCHLARPLVTVAAVKGFGGRKTFHHAGRHSDSPPLDKCSSSSVGGAGKN